MDRPPISNREWQKVAPIAVILGARLHPDGTASAALLRRVSFGCHLHQRGNVGKILMTGGATPSGRTEAAEMAAQARRLGIPETDLITESQARTTRENALYTCHLLLHDHRHWSYDHPQTSRTEQRSPPKQNALKPIVVVTDLYHLPRAWLAFRIIGRHSGFKFRFLPCRPPPDSLRRPGYWRSALREIPAFAADLVRCWLVRPPRPSPTPPETH